MSEYGSLTLLGPPLSVIHFASIVHAPTLFPIVWHVSFLAPGPLIQVLNVPPSASLTEVRKAYKRESLRYHPDKPGGDAEKFKRINEAYTSLTSRSGQRY